MIRLGDPVPSALSPLYRGQLLVHGLGYSPDWKTLAVVSIGSNSVTLIETATNQVKGNIYVGRAPHEAFYTPDGRELWVTVRGEDYVSVIDPVQMKEIRRIGLANGPGMTMFGPDGQYGFVCSSFTPELAVIDVASHQVIKRVPQSSPFCPNIAVSPENDEVWITLKDAGKVQVYNAKPPFEQKALLETGPITNHVNFVNNRNGKFAYVTIGGLGAVKVFRRGRNPATGCHHSCGRSATWHLAIRRWLSCLHRAGKQRAGRCYRHARQSSNRRRADRSDHPSTRLRAERSSERGWHR